METEDPWRVFYEDPEEQTAAYDICDNKDPEERICPAQVSGLKAQVRAENIKRSRRISDHAPYAEREAGPYTCVCEA